MGPRRNEQAGGTKIFDRTQFEMLTTEMSRSLRQTFVPEMLNLHSFTFTTLMDRRMNRLGHQEN